MHWYPIQAATAHQKSLIRSWDFSYGFHPIRRMAYVSLFQIRKKKVLFSNVLLCALIISEVFSCSGCCICCIWHPCRSPVCATACARWRFVLCRYASTCTYIRERIFNKGLYAKFRLSLVLCSVRNICDNYKWRGVISYLHNTHNVNFYTH